MKKILKFLLVGMILLQVSFFVHKTLWNFPAATNRVGPPSTTTGMMTSEASPRIIFSERGDDLVHVHLANRMYFACLLRYGISPPQDFIALWEPAVYYPVNYLYVLFPASLAVSLEVIFHLLLIFFGMYLFCRVQKCSVPASLLAALCLTFSGQVFGRIYPGHLSNLAVMAWFPLIFYLISSKKFILLVFALAMHLFAGHPQYVFYGGMISLLFILMQGFTPKEYAKLGTAYLLACIIALPQIIPAVHLYLSSPRVNPDFTFSSSFFFAIENIVSAVNPFFYGYWDNFYSEFSFNGWEMSFFFGGVGACFLAAKGLLKSRMLLLVAGSFLIACGVQTPLYETLHEYIPVFGSFRGVSKFIFFTTIFCCVSLAHGYDND
jgi:hypothetical protein